jgi:3-hydroxyacyl-[acyl-carrier-protein] dehydratase
MPGVLILEAMAQVGGVYALLAKEVGENQVPYFVGIDNAKFRKPVLPGDVLFLELALLKVRRGIYYFSGKAMVDGKLVAEAELKATFADK